MSTSDEAIRQDRQVRVAGSRWNWGIHTPLAGTALALSSSQPPGEGMRWFQVLVGRWAGGQGGHCNSVI